MKTTLSEINISNLKDFEDNPFIFREDTAFEMLVDSISDLCVLTPIIVRDLKDGSHEIISGHRRVKPAEGSILKQYPALSRSLQERRQSLFLLTLIFRGTRFSQAKRHSHTR